jgi:hypothetical protein
MFENIGETLDISSKRGRRSATPAKTMRKAPATHRKVRAGAGARNGARTR